MINPTTQPPTPLCLVSPSTLSCPIMSYLIISILILSFSTLMHFSLVLSLSHHIPYFSCFPKTLLIPLHILLFPSTCCFYSSPYTHTPLLVPSITCFPSPPFPSFHNSLPPSTINILSSALSSLLFHLTNLSWSVCQKFQNSYLDRLKKILFFLRWSLFLYCFEFIRTL